ncbi:hypothetical protein [Neosynechococcus sphagnicola]|uniref:hypothetical protein n=1 Tax=Neosynechococcus sphagnicola TaxID=1501145 RepID=UPI00068FEBB3|nr:hypothetical protein [Neosynechococcus sphagnicola]
MAILELILAMGLSSCIGLLAWNLLRGQQRQRLLQQAFYELLVRQNGCLSLIQLTVVAGVDATEAKTYLDQQVQLLGGCLDLDGNGQTVYRFPKLRTSPSNPGNGNFRG